MVVFGLFNGLGLLPVLLSWVGPAPYNTATHKMITSNMSITLKDLSGSKHAVDIDKLLTGNKSHKTIPNTSNLEKVEQYIDSLPEPTVSYMYTFIASAVIVNPQGFQRLTRIMIVKFL